MLTDDYKELLLKYITGKIDESGTSPQTIVGIDRKDLGVNIKDKIQEKLSEERQAQSSYIIGKVYSNQYENFIIYGNYSANSVYYGYVCIVNRKLEIISLLTQFSSGTYIYPLISIRQSETGQFYGLTDGVTSSDGNFRVALLNNILSSGILTGNYEIVLRQTYIIPDSPNYRSSLYRQNRIIKSLDSAIYYIVLHKANNSTTVIIKFTINVQEGNKWEVFETEYLMDTVQFDVLLDKSSGEEIFYFYGIDIMSNDSYDIYRSYQLQETLTPLNTINLSGKVSYFLTQVFVLNKDNIYISVGLNQETILYKVSGTSLIELYSFNWPSSNQSYLYLEDLNGIVFYKKKLTTTTGATISVGLLVDDDLNPYIIEDTTDTSNSFYDYNDLYIFIQYNLVSIYVPYKNGDYSSTYMVIADYNINNYNGLEYENINSLLPVKGRIIARYDRSLNPETDYVFARNLYNKYVRNNVTVCTLEVPNTLLNNIPLFYIGILGATNYYLMSNYATLEGEDIEKNIYETLDINFYNTIRMTDTNSSENIENLDGAIKVNQSISALLDYHNTQATKARINFTDGTSSVVTIDPSSQITISENNANYDFIVYIPSDKSVKNCEIISYDETIVYAIITGTFAIGAFNEITQTVSVF